MRNVVVLALLQCLGLVVAPELLLPVERVVLALVGEAVLGQILVHRQLDLVLLVGIEPKSST